MIKLFDFCLKEISKKISSLCLILANLFKNEVFKLKC